MERADLEQWKAREVARLLALVETERRYYQEIAAAIPVGLLVVAPDLTIVSANRAVREIFGLSKSPLLDTLLPAWVLDRVTEVLRTSTPQTRILVPESSKGRQLRIGILSIRGWDDESSPEALLCIEDLSGIEAAGVLVPRAGPHAAVDAAEQRFLEDQFVQSERVQAVSKLAARLAHDLNNMLMIVTGHGEELLNSVPAGSPLRADVQEILNASERMGGLTSHLLAYTRRSSTAAGSVELEAVLRGVAQRAGRAFDLSPRPHVVKADSEWLGQFVTSLLEREREISIETSDIQIRHSLGQPAAPLQAGRYAVISITLPGRAWEPEAKKNWFETVLPGKDPADDWAIFWSRAYGIIRQWGGDVAASAAPSGGTLLRVFLECLPKEGTTAPARAEGAATILVVEDEAGIRSLVQKILSRHGYQVLEAANGEEALRIFGEHAATIDLLITDVIMPRMGGAELVDRLRKQGLSPKVLYVSGYTDDPNIYAAKFPPGTAFLPKPFTLASLVDKVREVLGART
jgi:CheY-like chemotaxis protein